MPELAILKHLYLNRFSCYQLLHSTKWSYIAALRASELGLFTSLRYCRLLEEHPLCKVSLANSAFGKS